MKPSHVITVVLLVLTLVLAYAYNETNKRLARMIEINLIITHQMIDQNNALYPPPERYPKKPDPQPKWTPGPQKGEI